MPRKRKYINYSVELQERWLVKFLDLKKYKEKYGHCNVPQQWKENLSLGSWVAWQKYRKRIGNIFPERKELLNKIGFTWRENEPVKTRPWEYRFNQLLAYKEKYGNCNVPLAWKRNKKLGSWVSTQRNLKLHNKLSREKIKRLNAIGFKWKLVDKVVATWEQRFQELTQFKSKYGHCAVSNRYSGYKHLSTWVKVQRGKKQQIVADKIAKLNSIGFAWEIRGSDLEKILLWERVDERWSIYFKQLIEFKKRFRHSIVPQNWKENPSLGNWVLKQRRNRKMPQHRIDFLNKAGFVWRVGRGKKQHATLLQNKKKK